MVSSVGSPLDGGLDAFTGTCPDKAYARLFGQTTGRLAQSPHVDFVSGMEAVEAPGAVRVHPRSQGLALQLLRSELDIAGTFVTVAETSAKSKAAISNLRRAWRALKLAEEFAQQLQLDGAERASFRDVHGALCLRLTRLSMPSQE
jgi:hypothetical protein